MNKKEGEVKITCVINGKLYELVPDTYICEGCDLKNKCHDTSIEMTPGVFNRHTLCGKLHGIWKEVK
jgi:hypothetical protein